MTDKNINNLKMDFLKNTTVSNTITVDNSKFYSNDNSKRYNKMRFMLSFLIIVSVICMPAQAATSDITQAGAQTDSQAQAVSKPDNFVDYVDQEIETIKNEGLELPKTVSEVFDSTEQNAARQAGQMQGDMALTGEYNENYYLLKELNTGLPELSPPPNLFTPLATLEFFQTAIMNQQYDLAAYALNMNLLDSDTQISRSIELSKRLDFLLSRKDLYLFDELPDRPDGLIEPPIGSSNSIRGIPRRSIQLGYLDYRKRQLPITIQRVRVGDNAPIWVFSAQTVGNIDNLYDQYKPAEFERYLPSFFTLRLFGIAIWEFIAVIAFFLVTMGLGWVFSRFTGKLINWYASDEEQVSWVGSKKGITDLVNKFTVPLTFTISFSLVFTLVSGGFPFIDAIATATQPIVWIALVLSAVWLGIRVINFFANRYQDLQIDSLGDEEYDKYRSRSTYVSIFRRVFIFVMILGSVWIGLSEFANLEGLGKTLLTSAGIAGVVIGIAAQPTLGNIVAGLQIAVTQPIRIGDTVMLDGTWCTVEDLRYTYAILNTWDERRLFVPMRHFVTEIVENWSHPDSHQTRPVYLYVDYGANIDDIRQKFIEVAKASKGWDGETEPEMLALSVNKDTIELRGTVASDSPLKAWELECEVREKMLTYLYNEQKPYLPAERLIFKDKIE